MAQKQSNLYLPVNFWVFILSALDAKTQNLCEQGGFGEIRLTLKVHRGKVAEIYFTDEMRARGIIEGYEAQEEAEKKKEPIEA